MNHLTLIHNSLSIHPQETDLSLKSCKEGFQWLRAKQNAPHAVKMQVTMGICACRKNMMTQNVTGADLSFLTPGTFVIKRLKISLTFAIVVVAPQFEQSTCVSLKK